MAQALLLEDALARPRGDKDAIRHALAEARRRTWLLADGISDEDWLAPAAAYLSPPAWDLGHMANFEELWLVRNLAGDAEIEPGYADIYDAFAHPRPERPGLPLLERDRVRDYMDRVRGRALQVLDEADLPADRLTRDGFVHWMLVLHEHQHQETLLQSLQMRGPTRYRPPAARPLPHPAAGRPLAGWIRVRGGSVTLGAAPGPCVYDNESPPHEVDVAPFCIARYPVTCGEYLAFVEAGGYDEPAWWSPRGRQWLEEEPHHAPLYWARRDGRWHRTTLTGTRPVEEVHDEILCHVTWFEADAYARWAGARLPTEAEWERACRHALQPAVPEVEVPAATAAKEQGAAPRNPWGDAPAEPARANVDQLGLQPSRIGAYPAGASPCGAQHMVGDVWEWTSSDWRPYPGFEAFPYQEYSEVFFGGDYKVLRGGSWATRAPCATGTFRNWDHPYRRQVFAGIRLAGDAA